MAQLTWRNVDSPDFRPAMQGFETFSNLLGNAFNSARQGLDRFDGELDKNANNRILLEFAALQDADAAKAALAGLANDPRANRINAATIDSVTGRPNALIQQATNEQNLGWTSYTRDRVKGFDSAEDETAKLMMAYQQANADGKGAEFKAANPEFGRGLSLAATSNLFDQGQSAQSKALSIEGQGISNEGGRVGNKQAVFNLERGQWEFEGQKVDREEARQAAALIAQYVGSGHDGSDIDGYISASNLSGPAQMIARSLFGTTGGGGTFNAEGVPSMPGGGTPGGGDPSRIFNYEARGKGYDAMPESITTLGGAADYQAQMNKKGVESTAFGVYQIVGQTLRGKDGDNGYAKKALGANWRNMPLTVENQDKIAEAIFNDNRGSAQALRNQWVSLSPQQAEAVRKMPWSQAREYIARGESGASPAALLTGKTLATQGALNQNMQTNANSIAIPIQQALTNNSSLNEVSRGLVAKGGPLEGADRNWVSKKIQQIQAMGRNGRNPVQLNAAAAAVILERSVEGNNSIFGNLSPNAIGGDMAVNGGTAQSYIDELRTGDYQKKVVENQNIAQRQGQINAAQSAYDQANARLQFAYQRKAQIEAGGGKYDDGIIARAIMAQQTAAQNLAAANSQQGNAAAAAGGFGASAAPPPVRAPRAPAPVAKARPSVPGSWSGVARVVPGNAPNRGIRPDNSLLPLFGPAPAKAPPQNYDAVWQDYLRKNK